MRVGDMGSGCLLLTRMLKAATLCLEVAHQLH